MREPQTVLLDQCVGEDDELAHDGSEGDLLGYTVGLEFAVLVVEIRDAADGC